MPSKSEVRAGEVLEAEIITIPALEMRGEAATAAPEQEVPITPTTCGSATICWAAPCPPSGEHRSSKPTPNVTSCPLMGP